MLATTPAVPTDLECDPRPWPVAERGVAIVNRGARPTRSDYADIRLLASDYDGTLASNGRMEDATLEALGAARRSGLALALITGRGFDDLLSVIGEHVTRFDFVVAEDGAVLYVPATAAVHLLADPPDDAFLTALARRGVPFERGRVIVSSSSSRVAEIQEAIDDTSAPLHLSLNKGAAMYLPTGVDKGFGLRAGLERFGIAEAAVAGFGDAENDLPFLRLSGISVAVANALDSVKDHVDVVVDLPAGAGVAAFIWELLAIRCRATTSDGRPDGSHRPP